MKKARKGKRDPEMLANYDFSKGVRGKYAKQFRAGTNLVLIDPEIHSQFRTDAEVNAALRLVLELRKIGGTRRSANP